MSAPKIVIIGAGLIGLSTADALQAGGATVTVIDARPGPVRGASHANSGMLHPSQFRPWVTPEDGSADANAALAVRDLARATIDPLRANMRRLGLDQALSRAIGCYQIFPDVSAAQAVQARLGEDGIRANIVIDPERTFSRPALYFPDDRSADARAYGEALAIDLADKGVTFIYEAQDVRLRVQDEGRIAVALGSHRFEADHVIVACGAQSADILAPLGLSLKVTPVRGWAVDFKLPEELTLPPVPVMDHISRSALTVFEDRFRLSGTWNEDSAKPMLTRWAQIIPDAINKAGKPLSIWSGLRPVSQVGRPYISSTSIPGLWVNAGHGHLGWTLCAGSGALMARMILDDVADRRFVFAG
jgi:D-amino-acid dehydrogenase